MVDENNKLALITVGGTIGSQIGEDRIDVDPEAAILDGFVESFSGMRSVSIELFPAMNMLSEDMNPDHWMQIADRITACIDAGHTNIVVTHGTDTMAYTAGAIRMLFAKTDARIVFTGSFYPAESPRSDVMSNLHGAMTSALSANLEFGTYVAFGDSSGTVTVSDARFVRPMRFDSRRFGSQYENYVGQVLPEVGFRHYDHGGHRTISDPFVFGNAATASLSYREITNKVFQLVLYPGIDLDVLTAGIPAGSIVLVRIYHSGTVASIDDAGSVTQIVTSRPDVKFVLGPVPHAVIDAPYASTRKLLATGLPNFYRDLMVHSLYTWFVVGQMTGRSTEDLFAALEDWRVL